MNFKNKRFVTKGIAENVPLCLQLFMWMCIDTLVCEKDYLQVFEFSKSGVVHSQEEPEFSKEYLLKGDAPIFIGKVFVIDDGSYSTMLLAEEY